MDLSLDSRQGSEDEFYITVNTNHTYEQAEEFTSALERPEDYK